MGFTPSLFNKQITDAVLLWCVLQAGPPSLHYYCAVVLHSCTVLPPVGHSSNHEYHCCQLTRQSSRVLNFYRTFKVFIWLSLVRTFSAVLNFNTSPGPLPHKTPSCQWRTSCNACIWLYIIIMQDLLLILSPCRVKLSRWRQPTQNWWNVTFRGPFIVIYCDSKSQRDALYLRFIWWKTLHVSDRPIFHHQEYLNTVYTQ